MTIAIIILAYIANVFLNRYINKISYLNQEMPIIPPIWFFPLPIMLILRVMFVIDNSKVKDWFIGKNW